MLDDCFMTNWWFPDDYHIWLADDWWMTAGWLPDNCRMTAGWLADDWRMTTWWLWVVGWLQHDCRMTVGWLRDDCRMTVGWLLDFCKVSNDFPMVVQWLSNNSWSITDFLTNNCTIVVQALLDDILLFTFQVLQCHSRNETNFKYDRPFLWTFSKNGCLSLPPLWHGWSWGWSPRHLYSRYSIYIRTVSSLGLGSDWTDLRSDGYWSGRRSVLVPVQKLDLYLHTSVSSVVKF